ncbi:MAG: 2-oxoacid:acceptor oxidoreductase family protein [Enterobacterales bacterium]|nr:2-oxoacid:acceptor oxidoreductase family protein [Enterobacterales bacterium]
MRLEAINEFVIRFGNVNGTGSASANNMFSKAVFRMGVPVSPKNIFPSNIQGLPTWFEVRVTERGYLGSRGDVDFVVAINGQTLRKDYDSLLHNFFLYLQFFMIFSVIISEVRSFSSTQMYRPMPTTKGSNFDPIS